MSLPHHSGLEHSISLRPTIAIAIRVSFICLPVVLVFCLVSAPVHASSGSLTTGSVQFLGNPAPCMGGQWVPRSNCISANLTGCSNAQDLAFTYGSLIPSGVVNGIIVYFDGGDGTSASGEATEVEMLQYYVAQNYGVVQVQWSAAWQATYNPWPPAPTPNVSNVQAAACRPATVLDYVYKNVYPTITVNGNSLAGMCAQGFSAGSAAIAYSLAYYGAVLDNVELISGPVMSDIKQGCQIPAAPSITVCPAGQLGCQLGGGPSWTLPPTYVPNGSEYVGAWTNDLTCTSSYGTSPTSNADWLAQSIVDQGTGATPTFNYPNTGMTGWLCRSLENQRSNCSGSNYKYDLCPNNSSTQGEIFYDQITSPSQTAHYNVYAVDNCFGPEGVPQGDVAALFKNGLVMSGQTAVEQDMAGLPGHAPGQCVHVLHSH